MCGWRQALRKKNRLGWGRENDTSLEVLVAFFRCHLTHCKTQGTGERGDRTAEHLFLAVLPRSHTHEWGSTEHRPTNKNTVLWGCHGNGAVRERHEWFKKIKKKEEKRRRSIYTSATTFEYLTVFTAHFIFRQTGYSYVITDWHLLST